MYHVKSLNKEISDANKFLMEESIISEHSEEFPLEQLSYEECEEADKMQHSLSSALDMSPPWKLKRKMLKIFLKTL